jgi:hypothetical protein
MGCEGQDQRGESDYNAEVGYPILIWEAFEFRQVLPTLFREELQSIADIVVVPKNIVEKIRDYHAADLPSLIRWGELLTNWEVRGISRTNEGRLEVYGKLDGVWFRAVIARDRPNVLVTFHRVYEKKVRVRVERHGFVQRGQEGK